MDAAVPTDEAFFELLDEFLVDEFLNDFDGRGREWENYFPAGHEHGRLHSAIYPVEKGKTRPVKWVFDPENQAYDKDDVQQSKAWWKRTLETLKLAILKSTPQHPRYQCRDGVRWYIDGIPISELDLSCMQREDWAEETCVDWKRYFPFGHKLWRIGNLHWEVWQLSKKKGLSPQWVYNPGNPANRKAYAKDRKAWWAKILGDILGKIEGKRFKNPKFDSQDGVHWYRGQVPISDLDLRCGDQLPRRPKDRVLEAQVVDAIEEAGQDFVLNHSKSRKRQAIAPAMLDQLVACPRSEFTDIYRVDSVEAGTIDYLGGSSFF